VQLSENKRKIDLGETIQEVVDLLKEQIQSKNAQVFWDNLPTITGYPNQVLSLFRSLIDNSIKFSQSAIPPRIHIYGNPATMEELTAFHINTTERFIKVTLRDNGIGFDNEFAGKMFGIFQRLHTQYSEYEGKGIGLAIVKRVMTNHKGFVFANGFPMTGAEFILFFPLKN
jgi:signal transduction histidine kinase